MTLRIIRRPNGFDARDPGEALIEFGKAFPKVAVRAVIMDKSGHAAFFRLADGDTGLAQLVGRHYVIRLIKPSSVDVDVSTNTNGISIDFGEDEMAGGDYEFTSIEEAAEVSLWICGSFSKMMTDMQAH